MAIGISKTPSGGGAKRRGITVESQKLKVKSSAIGISKTPSGGAQSAGGVRLASRASVRAA